MDFLHCHDLPIWAQILLHPIEERKADTREEAVREENERATTPFAA